MAVWLCFFSVTCGFVCVFNDCHTDTHIIFFSDYHYVSREVMKAAIANGEFIENAEFSGNMYGTRYSPPHKESCVYM